MLKYSTSLWVFSLSFAYNPKKNRSYRFHKMDKFVKKNIKFNKKLLNKLKKTEQSGVAIRNVIQHLAIHPCQLKNFNDSVKDLLNEKLSKYSNM